jgi:hypothetical protein
VAPFEISLPRYEPSSKPLKNKSRSPKRKKSVSKSGSRKSTFRERSNSQSHKKIEPLRKRFVIEDPGSHELRQVILESERKIHDQALLLCVE